MYTALVLDKASKNLLFSRLNSLIPKEWKIFCHHMTINMGSLINGPAKDMLGQKFTLIAHSFALNDRVFAVGIQSDCPSKNQIKHVTIAVNQQVGAKPVESNCLESWNPIAKPLLLSGIVSEVDEGIKHGNQEANSEKTRSF
jgi:hypothetical protein